MATKAETRDRAAQDLGRLRVGQSLQDQDKVRIEAAYDEVYDQLKEEGLNTWASDGDCPDAVAPHLAALVADNCLNTYGAPPERYQRIKLAAAVAIREIRRHVTPEWESLEDPTDY